MKQFSRIILALVGSIALNVQAAPPNKKEIQQNKTATSAGRDLLKSANIQTNTEVNTETQVLTAVVSIVAIAGGTYGNIDITQTAGSQSITTGNVGGGMTSRTIGGRGKGGKASPITISGSASASQNQETNSND